MAKATKPDRIRHVLTVAQLNAVDLLASGKTDQEVAEAVGVTRPTVCDWRNHYPAFMAELNRRRQDLWGTSVDQLRALLPRAVATLAYELDGGADQVQVALVILRLAGLDRTRADTKLDTLLIGPTDPEDIIDGEALRRRPDPLADLIGGGKVSENEREAVLADWIEG